MEGLGLRGLGPQDLKLLGDSKMVQAFIHCISKGPSTPKLGNLDVGQSDCSIAFGQISEYGIHGPFRVVLRIAPNR